MKVKTGQVPDRLPAGAQVVEVGSLSTAQDSDPVVVGTVKLGNQEIGLV